MAVVAICLLPVLIALYVGATTLRRRDGPALAARSWSTSTSTGWPARVLLDGGDFYDLPGPLQFLYPPFAAVLAVPLAVLPSRWCRSAGPAPVRWLLVAVLHRFGLTGWVLSLVATAAVFFVQPVLQTLAFGQLGIFLVALVCLDLVPGPRVFVAAGCCPKGC